MLNGSFTSRQVSERAALSVREFADSHMPSEDFVCVNPTMRRLFLQAEIVAPRLHLASFQGEPGTGKHLFARLLHHKSPFASASFRRHDAREWLVTETDLPACDGTLYLDRVDLLSSSGQHLLLSFVKAVQSDLASTPRFLLLTSSHASLRELANQGRFLPDLAFRLSAVRFLLPPLRNRREDIAPLAQTILQHICHRYQQPPAIFAPGALQHLVRHSWPGNVRELASTLESAIIDSPCGVITAIALHQALAPVHQPPPTPPSESSVPMTLNAAIRRHIQHVLHLNHGNKLRAARQLGISRSTLYRMLADPALNSESAILP